MSFPFYFFGLSHNFTLDEMDDTLVREGFDILNEKRNRTSTLNISLNGYMKSTNIDYSTMANILAWDKLDKYIKDPDAWIPPSNALIRASLALCLTKKETDALLVGEDDYPLSGRNTRGRLIIEVIMERANDIERRYGKNDILLIDINELNRKLIENGCDPI